MDHGGVDAHAMPSAIPMDHDKVHRGNGRHTVHDKHEGHDPEAFRRRFWISLTLTIPVVLFSEMIQDWLGYSLDGIPGHNLVSPVLGTFVFIYGGNVFLVGGWRELRDRQPGMMLHISLAISVAFLASLASTAGLLDI